MPYQTTVIDQNLDSKELSKYLNDAENKGWDLLFIAPRTDGKLTLMFYRPPEELIGDEIEEEGSYVPGKTVM